jgi:hypothetical protein
MSVGAIGCPAKAALALSTKIAITNDVARIETPTVVLCGTSSNNIHYRCGGGHRTSLAHANLLGRSAAISFHRRGWHSRYRALSRWPSDLAILRFGAALAVVESVIGIK